MDIHRALHLYVERIVGEVDGMKVLLVDNDTVQYLKNNDKAGIISCICPQSYLLEHEVFLVDLIDNSVNVKDKLTHCKCIAFLRPTAGNIDALIKEVKDSCYAEYHLCINNAHCK